MIKGGYMTKNMSAFLAMIARSEGTDNIPNSDNGYRALVGGGTFDSYADHPRKLIKLQPNLSSTAAGRYQILARIYDHYKVQLHLPDFSPLSQDKIALQLIHECHAEQDIEEGNLQAAIRKCGSRWASLPNNSYAQHQNTEDFLKTAYLTAGGIIA